MKILDEAPGDDTFAKAECFPLSEGGICLINEEDTDEEKVSRTF